ncbi:MAG: hypothetical protein JSW51_13065 [Gemmatimonadota bacterium]|nr:MAG: hypothetical protein JSW51_13065 [Gemmatimonadota bacterium]
MGGRPIDSVLTDGNGAYRLRSAARDTAAGYLVSVEHGGVGYFSEPFIAGDDAVIAASSIVAYDTSHSLPEITVVERHIIIRSRDADGTRRVLELIGLGNDGFVTRVTSDSTQPVWQGAIPSEALQFEVGQGDVSPQLVFRNGDSVAVMAPLSPGSKQILITYLLPASVRTLNIPVDQPVQDMNIMFEDTSATVAEGPFTLTGVEQLDQVSLFRYSAASVLAGTPIQVRFGTAGFAVARLWWIIIPIVALTMGAVLYWWLKQQPVPAATPVAADTDTDQLARQIALMDQEYEARKSSMSDTEKDTYHKKRAELKASLSEMLAAGNKPS